MSDIKTTLSVDELQSLLQMRSQFADICKRMEKLESENERLRQANQDLQYNLRQTNTQLNVLNESNKEHNINKTPEEMIESSIRMTKSILGFDTDVAVITLDTTQEKWFALDEDGERQYLDILPDDRTLISNALYNNRQFIINNEQGEMIIGDHNLLQNINQNIATIPMVSEKKEVMGVIVISRQNDIRAEDITAVQGIAGSFGRTLDAQRTEATNYALLHDELTHMRNRHGIKDFLKQTALPKMQNGTPVSFVYADIDDFKKVNDTYGHKAGDIVLAQTAAIIQSHCRHDADCGYRDGGEELGAIFVGIDEAQAIEKAEAIRKEIAETPFIIDDGRIVHITVSMGTSQFTPEETKMATKKNIAHIFGGEKTGDVSDSRTVKQRADENVYASKSKGKNCVTGSKTATLEYIRKQQAASTAKFAMHDFSMSTTLSPSNQSEKDG